MSDESKLMLRIAAALEGWTEPTHIVGQPSPAFDDPSVAETLDALIDRLQSLREANGNLQCVRMNLRRQIQVLQRHIEKVAPETIKDIEL